MAKQLEKQIFFCKPVFRTIESDCDMYSMHVSSDPRIGAKTNKPGQPVHIVRNDLTWAYLNTGTWEYYYSIDSDIKPPFNALDLLLSCNSDIAVLPYNTFPGISCLWDIKGNPIPEKEIENKKIPFNILSSGLGCLLIRRKVFETIPAPWFEFEGYATVFGPKLYSEDRIFFRKANDLGFTIKAYPAKCIHLGKGNY